MRRGGCPARRQSKPVVVVWNRAVRRSFGPADAERVQPTPSQRSSTRHRISSLYRALDNNLPCSRPHSVVANAGALDAGEGGISPPVYWPAGGL